MNPTKILRVAAREFASTALTKGFLIGALVVPALIFAMIPLIGILVNQAKPPTEQGEVIVIDRTGSVGGLFADRISPEAIAERRMELTEELAENIPDLSAVPGAADAQESMNAALQQALGEVPKISVDQRAADADVEAIKEQVRTTLTDGVARDDPDRLLGALVIAENAVMRGDGDEDFGGFELFVRPKLDDRTVGEIRSAARWAILEARFSANNEDREELNRLTRVNAADTQEITETGTREASFELGILLPGAFMILLMMGVFTGGQYLLTTTIEEKSSRVVEILLSACSAMELMTGKILGQMAVGLLLTGVYSSVGIAALATFALTDLIDPMALVYMAIFFILSYAMFGSLMAAIGSAVNELREAQSLMGPVMLLTMIPYMLFLPISRDPSATYSVVLSYIPPISPFVMMLRVTSSEPPATWEVLLSIAVSGAGALFCLWFAAKVFRVGLLMFGKPPNFATLVKWVRMA
ncbi:MAG: ABC transporter permease [Planctomycetota bacterium]